MKYACNTCGARYAIPDSRVVAAGEQGLRVRCSRCRAIMAVCLSDRGEVVHDDDITQPLGVRHKKLRAPMSDPAMQVLPTEVGMAAADAGPAPAALSRSGVYRPLPGVSRGVTGLHMPTVGAAMPGRDWYAAFGGRARGPYSRTELELLAEQGRVRSSTLVWRPGFEAWRRVRGEGKPHDRDLDWLRGIVDARKRRERAASDRAAREHGIHRLHLDDLGAPPKTPPPLPVVDYTELDGASTKRPVLLVGRKLPKAQRPSEDALAFAADRVFGQPQLGETRVRELERSERRTRHRAFLAGALLAGFGVVLVAYTLPALGLLPPTVVEAVLSLLR